MRAQNLGRRKLRVESKLKDQRKLKEGYTRSVVKFNEQ